MTTMNFNEIVPNIILDDIKICYGDRKNLVQLGFIQSGEFVSPWDIVSLCISIDFNISE